MRTCQDVLNEVGVPLYMKIDIETYDINCILSLEPQPLACNLPAYISFERDRWENY